MYVISSSASKRKRGGPGGLNKVCAISPELQTIVGETAMSRTQVLPNSITIEIDTVLLVLLELLTLEN
jgi:hypothetical protein